MIDSPLAPHAQSRSRHRIVALPFILLLFSACENRRGAGRVDQATAPVPAIDGALFALGEVLSSTRFSAEIVTSPAPLVTCRPWGPTTTERFREAWGPPASEPSEPEDALQESEVVIAFPQMDVHFDGSVVEAIDARKSATH